jgi:hypothetical protein
MIPTATPTLEAETYELVLDQLLADDRRVSQMASVADAQGLVQIVKRWPSSIYNGATMMGSVQGELDASPKDPLLLEAMGEL